MVPAPPSILAQCRRGHHRQKPSPKEVLMTRLHASALASLLLSATTLPAQDGIRRAKIKNLDLDRMTLTLTIDGKDRDFTLTEQTRVLGATGKDLRERLRDFKAGEEVFFKVGRKGSKEVIEGLKLTRGEGPHRPALPRVDTSKLKPLTELGK